MKGEKMSDPIQEAAALLRNAQNILFMTGAGISADSGLPTYRGVGGLYEKKNTEDGIPIYVALSGNMFKKDPSILWKYLKEIGHVSLKNSRYNRGHEVIAWIEQQRERVWVLTQNVDGFHTAAGSKNVIEIHGNMHHLHCLSCPYTTYVEDYSGLETPPKCPDCNGTVRPDVVLFGEELPDDANIDMEREISRGFEVIVSVGTSSVFPYIFGPLLEAERRGTKTIEINSGRTEMSRFVDVKVEERAAIALDAIWKLISA